MLKMLLIDYHGRHWHSSIHYRMVYQTFRLLHRWHTLRSHRTMSLFYLLMYFLSQIYETYLD